jgi:hypothetical protein
VDTAGTLWEQTQTTAGGGLSPLTSVGWTAVGFGVKSVAAVVVGPGRVEVFAVDTAGTLWEQTQAGGGGSLSPLTSVGWTAVGSGITAVAAVPGPGGAAEVFALDTGDTLWEQSEPTAGTPLSPKGWSPVGSGVTSVAAAEGPGGAAEVFAADFAGTLWEQTEPAAGTPLSRNGWSPIGAGVTFTTTATNAGGAVEVFALDSGGTLWEQTQPTSAGGGPGGPYSPHGWAQIGAAVEQP